MSYRLRDEKHLPLLSVHAEQMLGPTPLQETLLQSLNLEGLHTGPSQVAAYISPKSGTTAGYDT